MGHLFFLWQGNIKFQDPSIHLSRVMKHDKKRDERTYGQARINMALQLLQRGYNTQVSRNLLSNNAYGRLRRPDIACLHNVKLALLETPFASS